MAKQINELPELEGNLIGTENVPIQTDSGVTRRYPLRNIKTLVTKADVGLGNVDNTSDAQKPISVATQNALAQKANLQHNHPISDITELQATLDNKSNINHSHVYEEIVGLPEVLATKANILHTHDIEAIDGLQNALNAKANTVHTHVITDVAGLQEELNGIRSELANFDVEVGDLDW